ncbi:hypothetical protein GVAV_003060 [Gurleya vavrai]
MLFFFINFLLAKQISLAPNKQFKFEVQVKENELFKFEFHEQKNLEMHCLIVDDLNRKLLDTTTNFSVLHWTASRDTIFFITITNNLNQASEILFRTPDVNKEMYSAIGPITDKDLLAEFDSALKRNLQDQRAYLEGMAEHEAMTKSTGRIFGWLVIIEIISCIFFIRHLQKKTLSLFENKRVA